MGICANWTGGAMLIRGLLERMRHIREIATSSMTDMKVSSGRGRFRLHQFGKLLYDTISKPNKCHPPFP